MTRSWIVCSCCCGGGFIARPPWSRGVESENFIGHVRGRQAIQDAAESFVGIGEDEITEDGRFGLETVACLGTCFLAPVVMIDHDYYGSVAVDELPAILEGYE